AVCNNSGAYDSEMSNLVERVEVLLATGEKVWLSNSDLYYSHRNSVIKRGEIKCCILRIELCALFRKRPEILQEMAQKYTLTRKENYEGYENNLGSVFSRLDIFSGRLFLNVLLRLHRYLSKLLPYDIRNKTRKLRALDVKIVVMSIY
ncbi:MAG: hypothetical protein GY781_11995, partial [Gammaproteobacteria bacterium]|nr:hypothetical protein [Gammaproteobacteria bacterium]